jgi:cell division transport system permease protein
MLNLKNYFTRHVQAGLNSLGQFSRAPLASFITCLVIGVTLTLPTALFVMLKNAENIQGSFQQTTQLTLYLKKNITEKQTTALSQMLQKNPAIEKAVAVSPDEGLKELQQQAGFQGVVDELQSNPLPWTIVVTPRTTADTIALDKLTNTLKQAPEVENIQMDMLWVKRLGTLIALGQRLVSALALFLCIAMLLIVNNTVRSATQHNQKEIEIIKLIGGTNAFIRRPFLYAGLFYGLLGGIIAWQLVDILLMIAGTPVHHLAELYNSSIGLIGLGFSETLILLGGSMFLGLAGSWLAVTRHLRANSKYN